MTGTDLNPFIGTWVEKHGDPIPWEDLKDGDIVVYDKSTQHREWFQLLRIERLLKKDGNKLWSDRAVCYDGSRRRQLIDRAYDPKFYKPEETR